MAIVAVGLLVGLVGAYGVGRLLSTFLYGVTPGHVYVYALMSFLLTGVALVANWLPARRAATVDPIAALRAE